jgi:hypothetical protein
MESKLKLPGWQHKPRAVKARQARKNMDVWVRVMCFSSNPTYFIGFGLGL